MIPWGGSGHPFWAAGSAVDSGRRATSDRGWGGDVGNHDLPQVGWEVEPALTHSAVILGVVFVWCGISLILVGWRCFSLQTTHEKPAMMIPWGGSDHPFMFVPDGVATSRSFSTDTFSLIPGWSRRRWQSRPSAASAWAPSRGGSANGGRSSGRQRVCFYTLDYYPGALVDHDRKPSNKTGLTWNSYILFKNNKKIYKRALTAKSRMGFSRAVFGYVIWYNVYEVLYACVELKNVQS